jgi:hypothetical protein
MMRALVIVMACIAGAAAVWLFTPRITPVPVNPDLPSFSQITDEDAAPAKPARKTTMMSGEKRRTRAEQLIGEPLKYITGENTRSPEWFSALDVPQLERAMDECYLLTEPELAMQHAAALREEGDDPVAALAEGGDKTKAMLDLMGAPNIKQVMTCKNVFVAYFDRHGEKFDF